MAVGMLECDDGPAQMGHDLPKMHGPRIDGSPAAGGISAIEVFPAGDAARFKLVLAIAPASRAEPADIRHGIAPGAEFPIQDRGQAVPFDHVVADAEVL